MMIIPKNINEPFINLFSFGGNQDSQSHLRKLFLHLKSVLVKQLWEKLTSSGRASTTEMATYFHTVSLGLSSKLSML